MFHTAQWTSIHSSATPPLSSIKIWAHLTGVPLDLRYNKGLGLVAGLIGDPKETDDFTLNLVSLTLSHVKVEVDLTKPLPSVVEFERQSGEVVEVQVDYPWLPPKCSHCHELGHVIHNCLLYTPPKDPPPTAKVPVEKQKQKASVNPKKQSEKSTTGKQYVPKKTFPPKTPEKTMAQSSSLPTSPTAFKTPSFIPPSALKHPFTATESLSDKPHKPSLKRTRSSPTFSPPEPPKISYQSSKPSLSLPFPEVGTLNYLKTAPFINSSTKNPFYLYFLFLNPSRDWHYLSNHLSDEDGRIVLIWKDPAKVTMISQSRQMITCELRLPNCAPIIYSAIYASNIMEERTDLLVELLNLNSTHGLDSRPWMIGGDFNQILHSHEHSSFSHSRHASPMFQFRDCLLQLGVFDLRYYGPVHTWTNKRDVTHVAKKLDRCLINIECLTAFPNATATFLPPAPSDHTPCLTDLAFQLPQAGTPPFRFFIHLTKHPSFLKVVTEAWLHAGSTSSDLASLCWKLKNIKRSLRNLNKENFSNIQQRVIESYRLLQLVQVHALTDPTPETFAAKRDQNMQWQFLRQIEECYFMQKSRITWLREGDFNTTYFHRVCQVRASFNAIRSFLLSSGVVITDPLAMSAHAISHFQAVLGPVTLQVLWYSPTAWFHSLTAITCTQQQRSSILLMPTAEEITKLMFSLNPNKAPGPDGLTSGFFKASWSLLGEECIASIQTFFNSGFLPKTTNSTILSLVPKFTGASKISDYRPISCLNTLYKLVSRLLVRRLKPILQDLILPNQTAFVEGRLLVENTVLASELVNGYHKNRGSKRITIKVDIAKAFDTLSWDFLFAALESLELPAPFIRLLRACICTTSFMVGYHTARVSWETVTLTKEQGGLGVKDLHKWNLACLLKLVWMLFFRPKSVWVCWFKEVILRGDISNYWTVKTSTNYSWLVNKMIKVRDLVYPLLHRHLGNGETTRFWFDNWSPMGQLYTILNASSSRLGIPKSATVASLFSNGHWSLPPARTENQLALQVHLTTVTLAEEADYYEWIIDGKLRQRYKTGEVYTYLKGPLQTVPWAKIVWVSYGIPRHSFLTWLVLLDRCPTKDRLIRWGMNVTPLCLLCNSSHENRNHLFFDCVYSATIWRQIMDRCGFHSSTSWDSIVTQLQALQVNRDCRRLTLIATQATIYWIWSERNKRLHQQTFRPPDVLFSLIDKQ
ncbi:uncharacterized protein LOC130506964, partial [Raphanus sativus]